MVGRNTGYTLIEVTVTVSIAALLASAALPGLSAMLDHRRTSAALSSMVANLQSARLAAVASRTPVILCPTLDGERCTAGSDWSSGWLMYLDRGGSALPHPNDILRMEASPRTRELIIRASVGRTRVRYLPDGRSAGTNVTIHVCDRTGRRLGAVIVNNAGRPRTERDLPGVTCPV